MDALNAAFVGQGDLVFDIGAHVGDRTGSFARLGASVVALEPQPQVFRALRLIYGPAPQVTLINQAVGDRIGTLDLHINTANPTVSTASTDLIYAASSAKEWRTQVWDHIVEVPVTTLDQLIAEHGAPGFVKIDVEGFELHVLRGLTQPLAALSFEFTTIQRDIAIACVARLEQLASYEFNYSLGEGHSLEHDSWLTAGKLCDAIRELPMSANSGDVFARLNE